MIRVLIVDDSAFMRRAIKNMLESDPEIKVIDTARDGLEGIEKVEKLDPDVVTLDVEMPRMDGLEALKYIMERHPVPVIMVSSLTEEGAEPTLKALELGAVDFIPKALGNVSINIMKIRDDLIKKVKEVAKRKDVVKKISARPIVKKVEPLKVKSRGPAVASKVMIVAIGVSTGGPRSLQQVLPLLPQDFPVPILIVQHMPKAFVPTFASRLDSICKLKVKVAESGEVVKKGIIYIAPGGIHMQVKKKSSIEVIIRLSDINYPTLFKPSVDVMMLSVAEVYPGRCLGVIMTGMGNDGCKGMIAIKKSGGKTIAQDESTSVVFGMPKAAIEAGVVDKVVPLQELAGEIVNMV